MIEDRVGLLQMKKSINTSGGIQTGQGEHRRRVTYLKERPGKILYVSTQIHAVRLEDE
jgi:hypothetical protein